jgi:hypothetical protein
MPTREDALALFPEGYVPSEKEIEKKLEQLIIAYNDVENSSYEYSEAIENRKLQYPSVEQQLDLLFKDIDNDTLDKTGDFYTKLKTVKDNNPKPSE